MARDNATIELKGDSSQLGSELSKSEQMVGKFAGNIKGVLIAAAAAIAAKFTFDLFKGFVESAQEAELNQIRLAKTIENLGDKAGITVDQINEFATAMSQFTTFEDDAIIKTETLFARMGTLNADGIKSATLAAADLAATMGTDLETAAQDVMMALQNPEMGMRKLKAAGISFTEMEKELIKSLMDTGQEAEAQNMILLKLNDTVGGMAATVSESSAGGWEKFKVRLGEVGESIGAKLLPIIEKLMPRIEAFATFLENVVVPVIGWVIDVNEQLCGIIMDVLGPAFKWLVDVAVVAFTGIQTAIEEMEAVGTVAIQGFALGCVVAFEEVAHFLTKVIPEYLKWFGRNWQNVFKDMASFTTTVFTNMWTNVKNIFNSIWELLTTGKTKNFAMVSLTEGFQSTLEDLPKIAEREVSATEKKLGANVDSAMARIGKSFETNLAKNRNALDKAFGNDGDSKKAAKLSEAEYDAEVHRLADALNASGVEMADAYKKAKEEVDEKEAAKEGDGIKANIEDLLALNSRITQAAASKEDPAKQVKGAVEKAADKAQEQAKEALKKQEEALKKQDELRKAIQEIRDGRLHAKATV